MKINHISAILSAGVLSATLSAAVYQNNFENQDVSRWEAFKKGEIVSISSVDPAEGQYCLKVLPAGMKLRKSAMLPVIPGKTYQISARLRAVSGRVRMSVVEFDQCRDWLRSSTFFVGETASASWQFVEKTWKAKNPAARFITLQFDGGSGFADDISVQETVVKPRKEGRKMPTAQWKKTAGNCTISGKDTIQLRNGAVSAVFPVEKNKLYRFDTVNSGEIGQRILYYLIEYGKNNKPLNEKAVLFAKENTGGGPGVTQTFFTTGPATAQVRIIIRSVGNVSVAQTVLKEITREKSALKLHAAPNRSFYYPGDQGRVEATVYNTGKRLERFKLLARLNHVHTGETALVELHQQDYGGRVPGGMFLRPTLALPVENLRPGAWELRLDMLIGGQLADTQIHPFGIAAAPHEELTRENLHSRKEPVFFMMLSQWADGEMFRKFRAWGFDVVEPDFTWGEVETAKGVYDWSVIDHTLAVAKRHNLKVAIKVMCWNLPADLKQRMISSNNDTGACPPNRGESLERLTALWKAIAERYANHPDVIWYTVSVGLNDGPLHGSFGPCHSVKQCYDYSPDNAKEWSMYLKERFPLEEVSKMYGKNFKDWQEVPLPGQEFKYDPVRNPVKGKNIFDHFMEYNAQGVTQALTGIWKTIRAVDPKTPILWKVGGNYLERIPKGFEYDKLLAACKEMNVIFTSTGTPSLTGEPMKIEYARNYLPQAVMAGEVGAEGERFPAPPLCTAKCFYLTMRYDMQIMGFCVYPSDIPSNLWGYIKNMQGEMRNFERYSGRLRVYGDANARTYSQRILDLIYVGNSPLRKNMQFLEEGNYPFAFIYDRTLDALKTDKIVLDPGTPFFAEPILEKLLDFVRNGGTLILTESSGIYQPSAKIAALRKQAGEKRVLAWEKGRIFFPANTADLADVLKKHSCTSPVQWKSRENIMYSVMKNAQGDWKVLLFNPHDREVEGQLSCAGELSSRKPVKKEIKLAAATLLTVDLKEE